MKLVLDRFEILEKYIEGREVLDLGCLQYNAIEAGKGKWLHKRIKKRCKYVLGVDVVEEEVNKAKKLGYDIICGDVTEMDLQKKFDVVIAGELIEHIPNQGIFIEKVKKHLKKNGLFILTTPSADYIARFLRRFFGLRRGIAISGDHVLIHDPLTIHQLLESYSFEIIETAYWHDILGYGLKRKMLIPIVKIWRDMASHMIIVARITSQDKND